jgi:hypothetical protein
VGFCVKEGIFNFFNLFLGTEKNLECFEAQVVELSVSVGRFSVLIAAY